jgi:hypothetical protein
MAGGNTTAARGARPGRRRRGLSIQKMCARCRGRLHAGSARAGGSPRAGRCCASAVAGLQPHRPRTAPATGRVRGPVRARAPPHRPSRWRCPGGLSPPRAHAATPRRHTCRPTRAGAATSGWPGARWGNRHPGPAASASRDSVVSAALSTTMSPGVCSTRTTPWPPSSTWPPGRVESRCIFLLHKVNRNSLGTSEGAGWVATRMSPAAA